MNAGQLIQLFDSLAATNKPKEKQALLERNRDESVLTKVLFATLNPFATYGMTALPPSDDLACPRDEIDGAIFAALLQLSCRTATGSAAKRLMSLLLSDYTADAREVVRRIITKDLRCGVTATLVNKVWPKLIPEYSCMLAKDYDEKKQKFPCWWEPKKDGFRVNVHVDTENQTVEFLTRSGLSYGETLNHLKEQVLAAVAQAYKGAFVLDAEAISGSFAETSSTLRKKDEAATDAWLNLFDVVPQDEFFAGESSRNYELRREMLKDILAGQNPDGALRLSPASLAINTEDLDAAYEFCRQNGDEGIMVKDTNHPYVTKRSAAWRKRKPEDAREFTVVGSYEGEGKYVGMLGGLTLDVDGVSVNVGSGLTDKQRAELWPIRDALPGRLVEVEFMEKTPDGSLRHPRLKRFRDTIEAGVKE